MANNATPFAAFTLAAARLRENLEWINAQIENLEGNFNPDTLTWGDVGNVQRIENAIESCTNTIALALKIETEEE